MMANIFFLTTILFLTIAFFLLEECAFLVPYRILLLEKYGWHILAFAFVLYGNLFAAIYLGVRKLFLKDTGRKLAHLEKQLRTGESISEELSQHLRDCEEP